MPQASKKDRFELNDYHKAWIARCKKTMAESMPMSYEEACQNMKTGILPSSKDKSAKKN